jgi:hypothetical protein
MLELTLRKEDHDDASSDLALGEPNSTTMPKWVVQQVYQWLHVLLLLKINM